MQVSNYVQLIGHFGADPLKQGNNPEQPIAQFSMATNHSYKDDKGVKQNSTEWHYCKAFGSTAALILQYMKKGSYAIVAGRLQTRSFEQSPGNVKFVTEIIVSTIKFLDNKNE